MFCFVRSMFFGKDALCLEGSWTLRNSILISGRETVDNRTLAKEIAKHTLTKRLIQDKMKKAQCLPVRRKTKQTT